MGISTKSQISNPVGKDNYLFFIAMLLLRLYNDIIVKFHKK